MLVRACKMIPLEVVMRRIATGSYLKRHPEIGEGTRFEPIPVEFFIKDDARHDPIISAEDIPGEGIATAAEVQDMIALGRRAFETLEAAWAQQKVTLVDMKIEFGRDVDGQLLIADVIDNDSWRLWPEGQRERMLDKQIYREMKQVDEQRPGHAEREVRPGRGHDGEIRVGRGWRLALARPTPGGNLCRDE